MAFNWTCPYCSRPQTAAGQNYHTQSFVLDVGKNAFGYFGVGGEAIACLNPDCRKVTVTARIVEAKIDQLGNQRIPSGEKILMIQRLMPDSSAKPQPEFIPDPIREDYIEACRIRDLSPKASATLSRRCIQGMIRDFCSISKPTLFAEINELKKRVAEDKAPKGVSEESVEAIDHIRSLGNIGAHMEKDIDLIVPVDPDEAQVLIDLIESLFDEWYIARNKRELRFSRVKSLAIEKSELKADQKAPKPVAKKAD